MPLLEADEQKPLFSGVLNGIRVAPGLSRSDQFCQSIGATARQDRGLIAVANAIGTPLEIAPAYLPPGSELLESEATQCGGVVDHNQAHYWVPPDLSISRWGGGIVIIRTRGAHEMGLAIAEGRAGTGNIAGRPAAFFRPLTPDGFGRSVIIVADEFGRTILDGDGVTLQDLKAVAESLYQEILR